MSLSDNIIAGRIIDPSKDTEGESKTKNVMHWYMYSKKIEESCDASETAICSLLSRKSIIE